MKNYKMILILSLFCTFVAKAQVIRTEVKDTLSNWQETNIVGLDLTQVSFVNWNAGGENSISALVKGQFIRKYTRNKFHWTSELISRYGFNKQVSREYRKTDDVLQVTSTAGFKKDSLSNWFYSAKFNFNTQFTNGYSYPNTDKAISKPFAPAYVFLGVGSEYVNKPMGFMMYISPLTMKTTLVMDSRLADQGSFGVEKAVYDENGVLLRRGRKNKTELGTLITSQYKAEVFENIDLDTRLSLYSDYLNKYGNIDIDWQLNISMKVNKFVRASITTNLIYDDDIKMKEEVEGIQVTRGPRIQLKQILGVGLSYSF
ncbi:MAG: DUF3078 domain-containing protein [Flavobacterium sp.]|nr:DUF3078 domain-containing protein [Candidatus Neoflavobacterium equi]